MDKNKYIDVIGVGPGNPQYILPIAMRKIEQSQILIGGIRNLEAVKQYKKETIEIKNNLKEIVDYIQNNCSNKKIAILVSGDPGYHSLLKYIRNNIKDVNIEVTPGISSFTYIFSKLSMTWDDAFLSSVHGEQIDYITQINENEKIAFLTDNLVTPKVIAQGMLANGITKKIIFIGENLSYDNEKITKFNVEEAANYNANILCVMVIIDE